MNNNHLTENLNPAQLQAVTADVGNVLVLAGAGSGKTRVLTARIAWLIQTQFVSPNNIIAVTFTNKAAAEMKSRIESMMGSPAHGMWIGTFHSLAHRLLRLHWKEAGLPESFQIIDSDDQLRLIKRILKDLSLDDTHYPPRQVQWFINNKKDDGIRAKFVEETHDVFSRTMIRIYQTYEETCERGGLIDFAEIILRAHELWLKNPELLQHYQKRFHHILVDEFQDTNTIQYAWIRVLAGKEGNVMAVGDDDQSIYGWRGAKIENIQRFTQDFSGTETIRLEQNYRSTGNILEGANAVIKNNNGRLGKTLRTDGEKGDKISLYTAFNDIDEARFIVDRVRDWTLKGNPRSSIALLYRSNAQSRILEENLMHANIPYKVYGGQRFFDRAEIKDALAYLRLVLNRHDDAAFERVVNTPTRGIGNTTLMSLREQARQQQTSLWQTAQNAISQQAISSRAASAVASFMELINSMADATAELSLHEQAEHCIHHSGLKDHYRKEKGEKGLARLENLDELINATRQFDPDALDEEEQKLPPLASFLAHAALEAGEGQAEKFEDCVQLMTLHSAKGLEFPLVFLCGVEEGLFPHKMSADDPKRLEEERRLCYVGITRAMKKLYITYAECRRLHGTESYQAASRFIREIPQEVIEEVRLKSEITRPVSYSRPPASFAKSTKSKKPEFESSENPFKIGDLVNHTKFGDGVVMGYEGSGSGAAISVKFKKAGTKRLVLQFAKLTSLV